jgi:hypothetical protein
MFCTLFSASKLCRALADRQNGESDLKKDKKQKRLQASRGPAIKDQKQDNAD